MKNLFKMTTAALALVAFASCSNDELLGSKNSPEAKNFTSILEYEIEEPDGLVGTRAARNAEGKGFVFQKNDQLRVYDEDLGKFDTYTFATQFGREGDTKLQKDPAYALFPYGDIRKGYCNADGDHIAEIMIGERKNPGPAQYQVIEYSNEAGSETKVGDEVLYQCNVPMWGTVEKIDAKTVKADKGLKPLTGVLMLTLGKTLGNAAWVRLHSDAGYLGGTFYANLDDDEPKLYVNDADEYLDLEQDLYIDLRDVPSDKAVLYIPVIAGINDLQIARATEKVDNPVTDLNPVTDWTIISDESGYTFKRNGYHKVSYEYPVAAQTPWEVSGVLSQLSKQTEDLTLALTKTLQLSVQYDADEDGTPETDDQTIFVPKMAASVVTLDIKNDVNNTLTVPTGYTAQSVASDVLYIQDKKASDPFTGTLVIKASTLTNIIDFDINLPKAKVVILGNFATASKESVFDNIIAAELQFGDGVVATSVNTPIIDAGLVTDAIDIMAGATVTGTLDAATTAVSKFAPITIKGKVAGSIDTKGDVNVELAAPNEAITGILTFFRGGTTCTLKQGYIATITNDFSGLGEANNHEVTVKLDDANGITAIAAVTPVTTGAGQWADAKITLTESTLSIAAKGITTIPAAYLVGNTVYTAAQLEQLHATDAGTGINIVMGNDVNMANAAWKAPFGNAAPAAYGITSTVANTTRTIKNLSYNGYTNTVTGVGFFGNTANLTVSDIKFDNITFTKDYLINDDDPTKTFDRSFIGGICGQATGVVAITRSTVNLANNFGYSSYAVESHTATPSVIPVNARFMGIGGFVGSVTSGDITLVKAAVSGSMIQGYTSLGGFFGVVTPAAGKTISFDKDCVSNIAAFKSNYSNPAANDNELNLWRAAAGIGYIAFTATAVNQIINIGSTTTAPKATPVVITVPAGKEGRNFVGLGTGAGQTLWSYTKGQNWIGICGTESAPGLTTTSNVIRIGADNYAVPQVAGTAFGPVAPALALYNWVKKN